MEYEKKFPSYTKIGGDLRTDEGQLLWPERFDKDSLPGLKKEMGSMVVAAQYQQRPVPAGGAIFKEEWIKYYSVLPEKFDKTILSWDMAFKGTDTSDYVVGQVWGQVGANYYLIDQVRGRWDFVDTCVQFEALAKAHPKALAKLVEDKANGSAVITSFQKKIPGIVEVNPEGGKESRANAVSPLVESGNVFFPLNAPWTKDLVTELLSFPNGANDDQVDSLSQALNYLHASATRLIEAMKKMQSRGLTL
jgi:predicted phage terminase large subunit-like protein